MNADGASPPLDVARVESLVTKRIAGDKTAAIELTSALCAFLLPALSRTRLLSRRGEDAPREVMTRVLDKLLRDDARALVGFQDWKARNTSKSIRDWLTIVLMNAAREYVRASRSDRGSEAPSRARVMNELVELTDANVPGVRPPMTPLQTARAIAEFARDHLPADQLACLSRWLEGEEFGEIALAAGMASSDEAARRVRAAIATLRRRFATPPTPTETP